MTTERSERIDGLCQRAWILGDEIGSRAVPHPVIKSLAQQLL